MDPRDVYPEPIYQGIYAPLDVRNPVPKSVAFQMAYEHVSNQIIDEFQYNSWFFDHMPRVTTTNYVHCGGTTTYKYYRIANLAYAFPMDGALMKNDGIGNEWKSQISHAVLGISDLFNEMVIRGDSAVPRDKSDPAVGPGSFDGLDKIIRKESLHVWNDPLDLTGLSNTSKVGDDETKSYQWHVVINKMRARLRKLRPAPTFILGNSPLISALRALGCITGTYQMPQNDFGFKNGSIMGIELIPMGHRCAKYEEIIPTTKLNTKCRENPGGKEGKTYETVAYVGSFGADAIMGLQPPGGPVSIRQLDLTSSGYVKKVDIEMQIGMVVMSRHACGMFTKICLPKNLAEAYNCAF